MASISWDSHVNETQVFFAKIELNPKANEEKAALAISSFRVPKKIMDRQHGMVALFFCLNCSGTNLIETLTIFLEQPKWDRNLKFIPLGEKKNIIIW